MSAVVDIQKEGEKGQRGKGVEGEKPSMDPFMAELAASFNQLIDADAGGEVKLKPMAPVDLGEEKAAAHATQTVGEVVVERARVEKEKAPNSNIQAPEKPQTEEKLQTTDNPEDAKLTPESAKEPAKTAQVKVKARKAEPVTQAPPVVVAPVPEKKEPPKEEAKAPVVDEYEKGLSDGQREELELARAAEKFLPEQYRGQSDKLVGFFKKVDEFANSHPDLAPESEEFKEFVERQRPAYREGDRRRVERMQIKAEVTEAMRKEIGEQLAKETEGLKRRQYELETKPVVAKTLETFQDGLFGQVPKEMDESLAEVGKVLQEEGFAEAAAKFPVEAPIYESTVRAAGEYLDLVHGLKAFNEQDETHRWLVSFIDRQVAVIKGDAERRMDKGRDFLAPHEYLELAQKDAQAARKHWTFSEEQILDMLALNAHLSATNRIKELEAAGFARKKPEARSQKSEDRGQEAVEVEGNGKLDHVKGETPHVAGGVKSAEEGTGTVSPRAGTTGVTGVATGGPNVSETARFFELLVPGGGKFAA